MGLADTDKGDQVRNNDLNNGGDPTHHSSESPAQSVEREDPNQQVLCSTQIPYAPRSVGISLLEVILMPKDGDFSKKISLQM